MKSDGLMKVRFLLIHIGKVLPFLICFLVFISYFENMYALITKNFLLYGDYAVLNKPISWFIGSYFEYNMQTLFIISIVSFAIRTCIWNKLSIAYLAVQLYEKSFFAAHEYDVSIYYIVTIINIELCLFFCCKGIKILTTKTSTQ